MKSYIMENNIREKQNAEKSQKKKKKLKYFSFANVWNFFFFFFHFLSASNQSFNLIICCFGFPMKPPPIHSLKGESKRTKGFNVGGRLRKEKFWHVLANWQYCTR